METIKLKKNKSREMSEFVVNHLLFEYARNTLDPERKKSVERSLETTPELQNEFIKLINGIQYCEKLSETLVNDAAIKQIELQSSQVNFIVNRLRWHQWPLGFKWLLEAGVVAMLLVIVLNVLPLNRIIHLNDGMDNQTVIAEIDRKKKPVVGDGPVIANQEEPAFTDEEVKQETPATVTAGSTTVAANAQKAEPLTPKSVETANKIEPRPLVPPKPVAIVQPPVVVEKATPKSAGAIFRGQFLVTNAEMVSPKIKEKIKELGGQKAGEVEIGWLKTPNVYYFHFTVPEAKLGELELLLKDYSTGKLVKESHPRMMPDGIIRLIFTVEEKPAAKQ